MLFLTLGLYGLPQEYAATYIQTNTPIILIFVILIYYFFLYNGWLFDLIIYIGSMISTVILQIRCHIVRYMLL